MSSFVLKIIACIAMFIDHSRYIIPTHPMFMAYIGRLAFPIFAFQISEGYRHTKNFKKYMLRLFIIAIISQIPYKLLFPDANLNVIFTLFLGLVCLFIYDVLIVKNGSSKNSNDLNTLNQQNLFKISSTSKILNYTLCISMILLIMCFSEIFHTDYGFYGISIILLFYILKNKKLVAAVLFTILTTIFFIVRYNCFWLNHEGILLFICTLLAIIPCFLYNEKQGPNVKYLIYLFYPLHILVLYLLEFL